MGGSNKRKHKKRREIRQYSLIVDGETEVWYFQMMKVHEILHDVKIEPEIPKKKKLADQFRMVKENARDYDMVIWLLDLDTLIKETAETPKGRNSKILEFKKYYEVLEKYENVEVLVNTPCLEFWYLLHFEATGKFYSKCENAEKAVKKSYLKDYQKTQHYYKKRDNDIYKKLKPTQPTAMANAKRIGHFDFENIQSAKAEIYRVLEILGVFASDV